MQSPQQHPTVSTQLPYPGQRWLVEERDACGVGFIADLVNQESHKIIEEALVALGCLEHRGACSADQDSGDGAGLLTAIPWKIFTPWFAQKNLPVPDQYGVGMVFLPTDEGEAAQSRKYIEDIVTQDHLTVLGWREVPVFPQVLGVQARQNQPRIEQILVTPQVNTSPEELDKILYRVRSHIGKRQAEDLYLCSFSCRTIVYKGMVRSSILGEFYGDLKNPAYESAFAIYHRRFSTNTMPKWPLAQPMRMLGHNGEINTLIGNINWMKAREATLTVPGWTPEELEKLTPLVNPENSDSANLDSALELLVRCGGLSPLKAAMILVPEAYQNQPDLEEHPEILDFYEYYSRLQEPWDGPAMLVFGDGKILGASLDRNGLRPARYSITKNGLIIVASEAGVIELPESEVIEKGRLGPGQMIAVNLDSKEILKNWDIKQQIAQEHPYGHWISQHRQDIDPQPFTGEEQASIHESLLQTQTAFGYSAEDVDMILVPMAQMGKEPTFCMGDDIPLAVLSNRPHLLYDYFKQRFAQVTNPPIDPLRESLVMSLKMNLGARGNLLHPGPEAAKGIKIQSPLVNEAELTRIKETSDNIAELSTLWDIAPGPPGFEAALKQLCADATTAVQNGAEILILSDRLTSIGETHSYLPPLLAVGAVHHTLIRAGVRLQASIILDTAQCWSTHHYACLIGYGASAICPYLALETLTHWWHQPKTQRMMGRGQIVQLSLEESLQNYRQAVETGLLKILSKMGISLLSSYQGAQIFEAIGLGIDLTEYAFQGTTSRVGGLSIQELATETISFHGRAFPTLQGKKLENFGFINYKPAGEYHMNSPAMSKLLHKAVAQQNYDHYQAYQQYLQGRPATALRDLLDLKLGQAIPLEQVEPVEAIVSRFCTGAMSLGSLSREAHETLAIAMNRLGGKSNSGEGGEDPRRFRVIEDVDETGHSPLFSHLKGLRNGDIASSAVKQIASGRFGVTPEYLMSGKQLEIKVAQGAKPGEGGQLPGPKVSPYIAMLRRSKAGVQLISPPPHHDIYSIEDLSQLIFDLHQINPTAKVSVKLVAEIGIGTIAAGVAKANADIIQISGHDGGTGASPLSSIKHAGVPWELGLTEVHRILMDNGLRDRVLLRVDGGLKTGHDVVMAALMGGEEYGFGSISMIAEGCIMARICHTNNCPVGVATQQEKLRKRFTGMPEHVVNFFYFIAEEVRSLLARLGYRKLSDIIGRGDLLIPRKTLSITKTKSLILNSLINLPDTQTNREWLNHGEVHSNGEVLDNQLLQDQSIQTALTTQGEVTKTLNIVNTDRTVGTRLSGAIAKKYGNTGFEGHITLNFNGSAGQSFGAFILPGMTLTLVGEANDYVGKGMHGGKIIIKPFADATYEAAENVIIGNTCLYGATGGVLYANGRAGERFAVRNSLGKAVIEGAGDHCCEYMTGGVIVSLGTVGRNVGAGMTGGLGYFLDEDGTFPAKVNPEIVKIQRLESSLGEHQLKELIRNHSTFTGSPKATMILENWDHYREKFWQVVPPSEDDTPEVVEGVETQEKTLTSVQ